MADLANKKILVCGMARSGIAAARLLKKLGANVVLQDIQERNKLGEWPDRLESEGIELYTGKNPDDIITNFDMAVLSPVIPISLPFVQKGLAAQVPVLGEIELAYMFCPCPISAVTGTNGKTTTTALLGSIMKKLYPSAATVGNIGIAFTDKVLELTAKDYAIAEISSFQLETIKSFRPNVAAVLNITPDHLDRHRTLENYVAAKQRIFENQNTDDFLILNYDDEYCCGMGKHAKSRKFFFSCKKQLEEGVYLDAGFIYARLLGVCEKILNVNDLKIVGNHNIENTLAAVAMAICAGVPVSYIRECAVEFPGVPHRVEYVDEINNVKYYNDSKGTNVDSAIKAIEAMSRPIILIGGGYDKGAEFGDWVGMFKERVKHLIVMGQVSEKIIDTCKAYGYTDYDKVNSLRDAVDLARGKAQQGDCVLLSPACASWDMFDNYEQRGNLFKEYVWDLSR